MGFLIFLLVLGLPIAEIYCLVQMGDAFGFVNTLLYLVFMFFLGTALIKAQSRSMMLQAQAALNRGEAPQGQPMQGMITILGGVLLAIPGVLTDAIAVLCLLPGTRHLIAYLLKGWLQKQMASGRMHVFGTMGGNPFGRGSGAQRSSNDFEAGSRFERDVSPKVIDVTPIRSETTTDDSDS